MGKKANTIRNAMLALGLSAGLGALGCASSALNRDGYWAGREIIENTNIKRTKVNVATASGENTQMVLVEEPGGGKWIEDNAGNVVYRWDPSSRGWRPNSNPAVALQLEITAFAEEKWGPDEFAIPKSTTKTATVKAGSDVFENATVVEASNGAVLIYDKDGKKIFERDSKGQWYKITPYGISAPIDIPIEY